MSFYKQVDERFLRALHARHAKTEINMFESPIGKKESS
jgi:hypothetical protein